jgi:hypothetical protein
MTRKPSAKEPLIALCIPCPDTPTGVVVWQLVDWTDADENGLCLPVFVDGGGEEGTWGSDYAIQQQDGRWKFPDGESSDDAGLRDAFMRRIAMQPNGE